MMKHANFLVLIATMIVVACSNYGEQDYTVLLPNAGEDIVINTKDSGTSITVDGSASSDVNNLGFEYQWSVVEAPQGYKYTLENATTATPTLKVDSKASGRYTLSLVVYIKDQKAQDFINIDVNPINAYVLLINAIEGNQTASLKVSSVGISGNEVAPLSADTQFYKINLNEALNTDGNVELSVDYNGTTLSTTQPMEALKIYTLYLTGTQNAPELLLAEKLLTKNTLPTDFVGLDFVNMASGLNNAELYIDASAFGRGISSIDVLFKALGLPDNFGSLNFGQNKERIFPANIIYPIPIWAAVDGERVSNNVSISLTQNVDKAFGSFILFKDSSSEHGYSLQFINQNALLSL